MNEESGCPNEFVSYVKCLRNREFEYGDCYKSRTIFEKCAKSKLVRKKKKKFYSFNFKRV